MHATIDWAAIGDSVAAAAIAGIGIMLAFALAVRGLIRASELRAEGRDLAAGAIATVGVAALVAALVALVAALVLVASDGPLL